MIDGPEISRQGVSSGRRCALRAAVARMARKSSGQAEADRLGAARDREPEPAECPCVAGIWCSFERQHGAAGAADWLARLECRPVGRPGGRRDGPAVALGRWRCRRWPSRPRSCAWLKSASAFASLTGLACLGSALGAAVRLELVEHEVAVGCPAGALVGQAPVGRGLRAGGR